MSMAFNPFLLSAQQKFYERNASTFKTLNDLYGTYVTGVEARGPLSKGALVANDRHLDGDDTKSRQAFVFQYNPNQLRFRRSGNYTAISSPGADVTPVSYNNNDPDFLEFTLLFEAKTFEGRGQIYANRQFGVLPHVSALLALTFDEKTIRPNTRTVYRPRTPARCTFFLGRQFALPVYVNEVDLTILEWNANLVPIRASADVRLTPRGMSDAYTAWAVQLGYFADRHMEV